jgi:hypothetical protein
VGAAQVYDGWSRAFASGKLAYVNAITHLELPGMRGGYHFM